MKPEYPMILPSFEVTSANGSPTSLEKFEGQVVLIVNVASKCGFTPQYEGLEELYQTFKDRGFTVIGFPCNQFGLQEPGDNAEIQNFCKLSYDVTFPVMAKIDVNGRSTAPIYKWLKKNARGVLGSKSIKWNFTKFLIGRDGQVLKRYAPNVEPKNIQKDIEAALLSSWPRSR